MKSINKLVTLILITFSTLSFVMLPTNTLANTQQHEIKVRPQKLHMARQIVKGIEFQRGMQQVLANLKHKKVVLEYKMKALYASTKISGVTLPAPIKMVSKKLAFLKTTTHGLKKIIKETQLKFTYALATQFSDIELHKIHEFISKRAVHAIISAENVPSVSDKKINAYLSYHTLGKRRLELLKAIYKYEDDFKAGYLSNYYGYYLRHAVYKQLNEKSYTLLPEAKVKKLSTQYAEASSGHIIYYLRNSSNHDLEVYLSGLKTPWYQKFTHLSLIQLEYMQKKLLKLLRGINNSPTAVVTEK